MANMIAANLRRQAEDCLRGAQRSNDPAVKAELLAAATWLHAYAAKLEAQAP
jgi:hypothetical protein